jgi:hypothetical protein
VVAPSAINLGHFEMHHSSAAWAIIMLLVMLVHASILIYIDIVFYALNR